MASITGRERLGRHESSECHKEVCLKLASLMEQLSSQVKKTRNENRTMLLKQLSSMKFLIRQGLAIRGHHDSDEQLMKLRSEDAPQLAAWLSRHQYLSHGIINELI